MYMQMYDGQIARRVIFLLAGKDCSVEDLWSQSLKMIFRLYQNCGCKMETCANILHYKTDQRIRKAVEKEEVPSTNWTFHTVIRIFGEYSSLETADEKANRAIYTSDMDTEKEGKEYRKHRTKKRVFTSLESEEEPYTTVYLPPPSLPLKVQRRRNDADENICSERSENVTFQSFTRHNDYESPTMSYKGTRSFCKDVGNESSSYGRIKEANEIA
ncbi:uncharacterized protein LOC105188675 isoform X1 [Harpegnathos saltator]|uniref:uncharacterized protein LOC105188675 isoform X1 n=1 Tax=Harpegnathos saltator TaxID=610380 RepID=UPI000DBEF170|nr:uncharacterized protein LOC105188675 isoform X1 [Harpegnathos saltator]